MDLKSIVLNKRMKFFLNITLISNCLFPNWACLCDAQDTLEPFHLLSCRCSMRHSLLPKSVVPNIACAVWEIPAAKCVMNDLSISLPKHLYSMRQDIQHAYGYDPYSQRLSKYELAQNYISVLTNHDNGAEHPLEELYSDTWSPILYGNLNWLSNANSFGRLTHNKAKTFIETKVTAIKLQGFNL